jgi:hypothetical protein
MFANTEIAGGGICGERAEIEDVLKELSAIRADMIAAPDMSRPCLDEVHSNYRESARNFLHYLALRRHDLRPLQLRLAALGLSSLGGVARPIRDRRGPGSAAPTGGSVLATELGEGRGC